MNTRAGQIQKKVQNPEKLSQTRISELLWIINDEYVVKLIYNQWWNFD